MREGGNLGEGFRWGAKLYPDGCYHADEGNFKIGLYYYILIVTDLLEL
jgi:hypothetical protein